MRTFKRVNEDMGKLKIKKLERAPNKWKTMERYAWTCRQSKYVIKG